MAYAVNVREIQNSIALWQMCMKEIMLKSKQMIMKSHKSYIVWTPYSVDEELESPQPATITVCVWSSANFWLLGDQPKQIGTAIDL